MSRALRVLVVDPEDAVLPAVAAVLRRRGHEVETAASVEQALSACAPDVLVSALSLGAKSGFDLLSAMQASGARPQTVLVTTNPSIDDCRKALQLGVAEFLVKPFRLEELVRAVELAPRRTPRADGLERTYLSTPACVELAARDVAAFALRCGLTPTSRARIASVAAELVDNARRHAYVHARGTIHVAAAIEERELVLRIRDDGLGATAETVTRARHAAPSQQGLSRAAALADELHVESDPGRGTTATARFASYRVDFDEEGVVDLSEHDFLTPDLARRVLHALKKEETSGLFRLSPALAVSVGRLLAGASTPMSRGPSARA